MSFFFLFTASYRAVSAVSESGLYYLYSKCGLYFLSDCNKFEVIILLNLCYCLPSGTPIKCHDEESLSSKICVPT